jgi:hypothetical protein
MRIALALVATLSISACATVYTASDFSDAQQRHQTVAILPFAVSVNLRELPEGLTEADLAVQERDEAYEFQRQIYSQFLQRYSRDQYTIQFQDIDETNILLERSGVDYATITSQTKRELAEMLGVDSVISGSIARSQPMKTGGAIAATIFLGFGATNQVNVTMTIHDGANGGLLWSYDHEMQGGLGSSPESVAEALMRSIARKFPYERA